MNRTDWSVLVLGAALVSCKGGASTHEPVILRPGADFARGSEVSVAGGNVTTGFVQGRLSASVTLQPFSISKHPVTVAEFRACVQAGVCSWADAECANPAGAGEDVALCVGYENAQTFCSWLGGDLPTLSQWLLAARGAAARRFAWGDAAPTCEQHPRATVQRAAPVTAEDWQALNGGLECEIEEAEVLRTGLHPLGASPSGIEDVLLSSGELLRNEPASIFSVCAVEERGCVVFGRTPGAIEAVERVGSNQSGTAVPVQHPYGFRCISSQEAR